MSMSSAMTAQCTPLLILRAQLQEFGFRPATVMELYCDNCGSYRVVLPLAESSADRIPCPRCQAPRPGIHLQVIHLTKRPLPFCEPVAASGRFDRVTTFEPRRCKRCKMLFEPVNPTQSRCERCKRRYPAQKLRQDALRRRVDRQSVRV